MGNACCSESIQRTKDKLAEYKIKYNDRKTESISYYNDINYYKNLIPNYNIYLSELNYQLSIIKDQLNISSFGKKDDQ